MNDNNASSAAMNTRARLDAFNQAREQANQLQQNTAAGLPSSTQAPASSAAPVASVAPTYSQADTFNVPTASTYSLTAPTMAGYDRVQASAIAPTGQIQATQINPSQFLNQSPSSQIAIGGAGGWKGLAEGDYGRLEKSIYDPQIAALNAQHKLDQQSLDESMNQRGIYSSGLAVRAQNDLTDKNNQTLADIYSRAAQQRYGLQQQDTAAANNYNLANAQMMNTGAIANAQLANQREQANQSAALQAALANQNYGLQAALANQESNYKTQLANQNAGLQAALANQNAGINMGQYNGTQQYRYDVANQANNQATQFQNQNTASNLAQQNANNQLNMWGQIYNGQRADANAENQFNLQNASNTNTSNWQPLNWLAGQWSGTSGNKSSGGSWGFNPSISL